MRLRYKVSTAKRIIQTEGVIGLSIKSLQKIQDKKTKITTPPPKIDPIFLVDRKDVLEVDWSSHIPNQKAPRPVSKSLAINWIMSPPGKGSGGHQNLFRFIRFLELAGHKCRIYLYSTIDNRSVSEIKSVLDGSYPKTKASIEWLKEDMKPADALFATGWETAYPVYRSKINAKRFYFVQDFEPYFYPIGSEYVLAENTYRFGYYGITAGGWLSQKLRKDYGMEADYFDFGADLKNYQHINKKKRKEVFFYVRPVTARRGFELGIMALELFHKKHPDFIINLAGWDISDYAIPFPHNNLGIIDIAKLHKLYNKCAVGLVMSLTNMSLLPLEMLACGVIPVVNDGENNRLVSSNPFITYSDNNPMALANHMSNLIQRDDLCDLASQASKSVEESDWGKSGDRFVKIVEREINNG